MRNYNKLTQALKKIFRILSHDPFTLVRLLVFLRKHNTRYVLWHRNHGFGHQLVELPYALTIFNKKPNFRYVFISYGKSANKFLFKSLMVKKATEMKFYSYFLHYVISSLIQKKLPSQIINVAISPNDEVYEYCQINKLLHEFSLMESRQYKKIINSIDSEYNSDYSFNRLFSKDVIGACIKKLKCVDINDWFVCLHIRDNKKWSVHRNNRIEIYKRAINYINSIGGRVIIVGDYNENFDGCTTFNNYFSGDEVLMMYILSHQKFMIGTSSGPSNVSLMFDVPVISTNVTEWAIVAYGKKSSYLPKMIRNKETKTILTASEVMELMKKESFFLEGLPECFEYIDNDVDSILHSVIKKNSEVDADIYIASIDQSVFKNICGDGEILWAVKSKVDELYYKKYMHIFEN